MFDYKGIGMAEVVRTPLHESADWPLVSPATRGAASPTTPPHSSRSGRVAAHPRRRHRRTAFEHGVRVDRELVRSRVAVPCNRVGKPMKKLATAMSDSTGHISIDDVGESSQTVAEQKVMQACRKLVSDCCRRHARPASPRMPRRSRSLLIAIQLLSPSGQWAGWVHGACFGPCAYQIFRRLGFRLPVKRRRRR